MRNLLLLAAILWPAAAFAQPSDLDAVLERADALAQLQTVIVARDGVVLAERGYDGHDPAHPTNIKSASKTVVSALVGIAIDKGLLEGVDQPIAPILASDLPESPDPRLAKVTVGNLLSMQAGLTPTSGPNYGRWILSRNWVRFVLAEPFESEPGGAMLYSTGSTHLLSAILTKVARQSTLDSAKDWFDAVDAFGIGGWQRDRQGIYMGGNQMAMSPRSLLAFGEVFRRGGLAPDGARVLSENWVEQSWTARTHSQHTGDGYGYGWFLRDIGGTPVKFAWGYGGQMLYIAPELGLTVVMTSDASSPSAENGYLVHLHELLGEIIAAVQAPARPSATTIWGATRPF
jgi:CubicO group peptidase (beta-lactamase class C family)